jgi:hypothetical protein
MFFQLTHINTGGKLAGEMRHILRRTHPAQTINERNAVL